MYLLCLLEETIQFINAYCNEKISKLAKVKFFFVIERQLINTEGMIEIENHQWAKTSGQNFDES